MHPNIEVMCMVNIKFQYATSTCLVLLFHHSLVSILGFPDVSVTVAGTAIPSSNLNTSDRGMASNNVP